MDVFNFCWLTLIDESKKSSVFFDKNTCNVRNDIDENFNKPVNRIAYLYKFGCYNISFFHQCFKEFFTKCPDSSKIIDHFRSLTNLNICSMSAGPGTDIIGLLYSLHLVNKPLMNSVTFKVISRHGSWRNLVNEMMSSSIINVPEASTCKLIECDFLKELSAKAKGYLKAADVLLMCNSFSSSLNPGKMICNTLERIHVLKPGALVFFVVSKEKSDYLEKLDCYGSFLYGPVEVTLENIFYNENIAQLVGVKPLCSGTSLFAVWQKIHEVNSEINLQRETEKSLTVESNQLSSAKSTNNKSDVNNVKSQILNMSNLKRDFSSDTNISSSDSIASSSQFSLSSASSQVIKKKDSPVFSDSSYNFTGHKIDFPQTNFNFEKNISPVSVNATDLLARKKYEPLCGSGPKKNENNMDSLLKNFESLITKFEGLIESRESLKNPHVKEKQSSSCQQCHQNMHQGYCRCSIKPWQFKESGSTCCCLSMCYNDHDHHCSTSVASNLYTSLPQEGPCIVIPLKNLSDESLTEILSIVSQNCSSVNITTGSKQRK